jgi:serine/threonine-protein kinase RsbW
MSIGDPLAAGTRTRRPNATPHATRNVRPARRHPAPMVDEAFDAATLVRLRAAVVACLDMVGAGTAVDDVVITAHELCSNAVKHGGGSGRLRMWREADRILCRVTDLGSGMVDRTGRGLGPPPPYAMGGRGLWIARRLAEVHIDTGPHGTTVTAAVTIP